MPANEPAPPILSQSKDTLRLPKGELPRLRRALLAWHRRHGLRAPWRTSGDPYQVLVAAVMAQQTQMSRVLPKFDEFVAAFPTVEKLARASTAKVLRLWGGLGYNLRALRLHRAARRIVREGGFPRTAAELEQIEGVGPFTAAIVASFAFGEPVAAFDTNVRRVVARLLGDIDGRLTERELRAVADGLVSRRAGGRWNQAMMDLGGQVCTARAPRCGSCPLARWCRARPQFAKAGHRVAEGRASYRAQPRRTGTAFRGSRRYYRGRIVQALRELPPGASLAPAELLDDGLDEAKLAELVEALRRDGLLRVVAGGRLRLP
ncbi:MAG: A/G-specific adenine glycosylase [Chloroflexi bacterium]|nr:A/G-specific adenine glycosylase [Chloroflexota bacterium]